MTERPLSVGPFRTVGVLGQGGMGRVLLGVGPDGRLVAVKQVHAELAEDDGFRARFRREVDASRRVTGACTAPVVDADPEASTPWLASQFVPGPSLSQALEAAGPLPEEAVRRLAAGLAQALVDVHRAGLVHRDLKPSNVLLAEDGVRVIDFGIVRAVGDQTRITHTGALIGSPAFMSPEQIHGREITPATDVFSLGVTLVMACTGKPPFAGDSLPSVLYEVVHAEPDLSAVPPGLRGIIAPCLAKDPALRPTPPELLTMVGRVEPQARPWPDAVNRLVAEQRAEAYRLVGDGVGADGGDGAGAVPPTVVPALASGATQAPARQRQRWRRRWPVVAVAVVAVLVAGGLTFGRPLVDDVYTSFVPEPVPTPGTVPLAQVRDKYTGKTPATCPEIAGKVTVPAGFDPPRGNDGVVYEPKDEDGPYESKDCGWSTRSGDQIDLGWTLYGTVPGGKTGAERAKQRHEGLYLGKKRTPRDPGIGFGEEAFWLPPKKGDAENCVLYVRDVNLDVFVQVKGSSYPPGRCESVAKEAAKSALTVIAVG